MASWKGYKTLRKANSGQTLFELLIALAVAVLIVTGIVKVVTISVRNSTFAKNQAEATRYAQEAFEWLRNERDKNWASFSARSGSTWCLQTLSWSKGSACGSADKISGTILIREATLTLVDSSTVEVLVQVYWADSSGEHSSRVDGTLTNWRDL